MRLIRLRLSTALCCLLLIANNTNGQGFSFNCARDTTIPGCNPVCFTLKGIIPDLYGLSSTYTINPTSTTPGCFPVYVQPDDPGGTPTNLTVDDTYSAVINLGFSFPFFGTVYNSLIASTNGYVSFDISKTGQFAHWSIPANLPSTSYDRALIMGPYHDLHPGVSTSPTQRVQYQTLGTAPHRRWVLSFYKVPLFSGSCNSLIENTHQIILYESTGIIEVTIFSKQICSGWNSGRAIVGIQNFAKTQGLMAPGRTGLGGSWGSVDMNESWRFVPSSGPSLFRRVELCDISGSVISTGSVVPAGAGSLEASFPNTCIPAAGVSTYIIRSVYTKIDNPNVEIFGLDTIRVSRVTGVNATAATNATTCTGALNGSGTITATSGTGPFSWALDGAAPVTGPSPYTFTNLAAGTHNVSITDANGCTTIIPFTINAGPPLALNVTKTDALCGGSPTGSITVSQPGVGAAPFQYSLNGTTWQASNVFNGLMAGNYTVYVRSSEGCPGQTSVTITEPLGMLASSTNSNGTCNGGNDGKITVSASGGAPGYQYSIDGTNFQASNEFYVVPGNYTVTVKDNNGCITSFQTVVGLTDNLSFTPQSDPTICEGTSTQLSLTSNAIKYEWSPKTGLSDSTIYNPVANP